VLLVQRDNPLLWELPGGGILPGEHPETTLCREVQEETGVCVEIVELLGWYERTGFRAHRSPVYLCHPVGGQLRPQAEEAVMVRFFPLQALPRGLFPWYRPILQQDLVSPELHPLQRTQHLGIRMVLHCVALDLGNRWRVWDTPLMA
jgi:8-oxo-dGTP pyrophosphatase MutT (NUDIX family)